MQGEIEVDDAQFNEEEHDIVEENLDNIAQEVQDIEFEKHNTNEKVSFVLCFIIT